MVEVPLENAESVRQQREKQPLYAPHVKVYPKKVKGTFRQIKWAVLVGLLGLYYLAPWLRWDRGPGAPDQAFLIDMPARRAYFLWIEIWPQEVYYIAGLLMVGAFGLFFATALFGRVWCGFTCPQTVWTDLFIWVERLIEGDRNARMRLDKAGFSWGKLGKKVLKHTAWLLIALATGGAWIMYFYDAPTLVHDIAYLQVPWASLFFIGLFTATTYLLAGLAREHVCTYMCPWPRFQSAMFDEDSLIVTYEAWRGEPRGSVKKKVEDPTALGDCVDCRACVAACPTGIDIRDGNQLECIGCALCIDACNEIMDKVGRPRNLITYDSITRQDARATGGTARYRLVRMRTILYFLLLVVVGAAMLYTLSTRDTLDLNVQRDRAPLFVTLADGSIRNGYTVKILNKAREERAFVLELDGIPAADIQVVGHNNAGVAVYLTARPDMVETYHLYVRAPRDRVVSDSMDITFTLTEYLAAGQAESETYDAVFRGPER